MTIQQYINNLNRLYKTGNAREHSYRGDLQTLLSTLLPEILVTNEPARIECGAPDYVLTKGKNNIPVGYIEAKDIGIKLDSKLLKEQFDRYRLGLNNLIITDYLTFEFYREGIKVKTINIASIVDGKIVSQSEHFSEFESLIKNFVQTVSQTIKNPQRLAEMLAGKARLMADIIEKSLNTDDENDRSTELKSQMTTFKNMLIHDIDNKAFSDIYSQTIAYGMFAARYNDPTLATFSRLEAANLIPKSNPFLRKLFQDIAGFDLDERLVWIVEELVQIFLATDVAKIMQNFGKSTKMEDPIIHFYETFLAQYDKNLRKARGVWYTPQPVVNFIVRAVDDILKEDFGLSQGLADASKIKIKVESQIPDARSATGFRIVEKEVHRVQILDPATGTGTFLAETVKHIHSKFKGMEGMWSKYVKKDLIPRLNGFELLMASYAMAHLKMDMLLKESGYIADDDQRFRIFLTNSLEEAHADSGTLFSSWLSEESTQANQIKKETPVMVVMGNPPYSISSYNNSNFINDLMKLYKKDIKHEKNIQLLSDDYAKFIRYAHFHVEKNGSGVVGFITKNTYLNVSAFLGMRKQLLKSFNKICIINLGGKIYELTSDNLPNENVFDIRVGVSIMLLIKTDNNKDFAELNYFSLEGNRNFKYDWLSQNSLKTIPFEKLNIDNKYFFFEKKNFIGESEYKDYFSIDDLFINLNSGVETGKDHFITNDKHDILQNKLNDFIKTETQNISGKFSLNEQPNFKFQDIKNYFKIIDDNKFKPYSFKPFQNRIIYYDLKLLRRNSSTIMNSFFRKDSNVMLLLKKRSKENNYSNVFITKNITDRNFLSGQTYCLPLYLYTNIIDTTERLPNLSIETVSKIEDQLKLAFVPEENLVVDLADGYSGTFAPIDLLDYIYAILHSPKYRETYKEFLKIDFPRIPYPTDQKSFWELVNLGKQIRELHLLESEKVNDFISSYPEDGSNVINKLSYKNGSVYINNTQYFANVPEIAWNFYIGGYQPAQKWLKDRKDLELSYDDIVHYNKMIVALMETDRLMKEIDMVFVM